VKKVQFIPIIALFLIACEGKDMYRSPAPAFRLTAEIQKINKKDIEYKMYGAVNWNSQYSG